MAKVTIDGAVYDTPENERLSDFLRRIGKPLSMPCGGRGTCGKCKVIVNGAEQPACRYVIRSDLEVTLPETEIIVSESGAAADETAGGKTALVLDIGTTTLQLALVSIDEKKIIRTAACTNPQCSFGADVMSRIAYCMEHGPDALQRAVVGAVNALIRQLGCPQAQTLFAAGNTTMLHLFCGVDCSAMGKSPYTPVFLDSVTVSGESLGLQGVETVITLPSAAAFVGADLTAGLNYVGLPQDGAYRLLIDLGTNAEVVLLSRERSVCTAAAAGPCFEGASISCGMSVSPGAICVYSAAGYTTIGGRPAAGICGTGLVDVIATLLDNEAVDETGLLKEETFAVAPGVVLTRTDVRQYQLAKSAVCAAVQTLMNRERIGYDKIDALYLAGGFSAGIRIDSAVRTGLLPAELRDKCISVGNSSLLGAAKYAFEQNDLSVYLDHMAYVDLAADPVFSERFIGNMSFPPRADGA